MKDVIVLQVYFKGANNAMVVFETLKDCLEKIGEYILNTESEVLTLYVMKGNFIPEKSEQ